MTIVVTVRVNDGIVLAADSATSFSDSNGNIAKVYNNANKIFNLVKGWPVGAMTYGAGSIGSASISTLSKDLRKHLTPTERPDPSPLIAMRTRLNKWPNGRETSYVAPIRDCAARSLLSELACQCRLLCRFSDAGMTMLSARCGGRRPKSAKARNRGKCGTQRCRGRYRDLAAVRDLSAG